MAGYEERCGSFRIKVLYLSAGEGRASEASGFVTTLAIAEWKWEYVIMDFAVSLLRTQRGSDAIWVVVDRLIKSAHFIPMRVKDSIDHLADLYVRDIVRLHEVPVSIVSDRDPRFTARLWQSLQSALGTKLTFSTAYHP